MSRALGLLLGAVTLAATAGALASLALFALAIGMVAITLGAGVSVALAAHRLAVTRRVLQGEAHEDQPIAVHLAVRGLGRLPLPVHLQAQVAADRWVPVGEGGGTVELLVGRRGAWQLGPSRLRLRDALGIFQRPLLAGQPEPLLILPTPDPTLHLCQGLGALTGDAEPDGLQPYLPGTPIGRIHWPALARGAGLQQRRLAPPPTGLPLVVVDTAHTSDPGAVDWAARTAAGVVLRLAHGGGCQVLLPGDQVATTVTDTAGWHGVHRRLAALEPAKQAPPRPERDPDVCIRAARAPARTPVGTSRLLPPGVVASKRVGR
jgi:uncharacterized protein (DUF58 family)